MFNYVVAIKYNIMATKIGIKKEIKNLDTKKPDNEKLIIDVHLSKVNDAIDNFAKHKKLVETSLLAMEQSENIIKDYARRYYLQSLQLKQQQPDSFSLRSLKKNSIMYIVQDSYGAEISPQSIKDFKSQFGKDIITTSEKFSISAPFMKKYGAELNRLIQTSKVIAPEDKPVIVKVVKESVISKGSIQKFPSLAKKTGKAMIDLFLLFAPKEQLKLQDKK